MLSMNLVVYYNILCVKRHRCAEFYLGGSGTNRKDARLPPFMAGILLNCRKTDQDKKSL